MTDERIVALDLVRHSGLNAIAKDCHRLAVARGKYDGYRGLETGIHQIVGELLEWQTASLFEVWNGPTDWGQDAIKEEAGDALHALLSVMAQEGIDVEQALRDAIQRNAARAREGV